MMLLNVINADIESCTRREELMKISLYNTKQFDNLFDNLYNLLVTSL